MPYVKRVVVPALVSVLIIHGIFFLAGWTLDSKSYYAGFAAMFIIAAINLVISEREKED